MAEAVQISGLTGVTLGVPDPEATTRFLADGLSFACERHDQETLVLCAGDYGPLGQMAIRLIQRSIFELVETRYVVAEEGHLDGLATVLRKHATDFETDTTGALRFTDPAGNPITVEPQVLATVSTPEPRALSPRRLGHLNLKAPDPLATSTFYQEVLGMKLSERIGDDLFFLRFGSEHHNLGLRPGREAGLHHLGFEIGGWHLYQPILDHLAASGLTVEYGPGRHGPGNNLFVYLRDPSSGLRLELFADMAQIPDAAKHEPIHWRPEDRLTKTINRWGPTPPESFLA